MLLISELNLICIFINCLFVIFNFSCSTIFFKKVFIFFLGKLQKDNLALSNDERQNATLKLTSDQRELEYLAKSFQEDRNNRIQIDTNKIIVETINVVNKFGRDNGYDLIINEGRISQNTILNGGTLYKGASVDITNDIAKVLEKNFQESKSGG